jgi:myo-inositol-1(or 4)-monophosphatase
MIALFRKMGEKARKIAASPSAKKAVSVNRFGDCVLAADSRINRAVENALSRLDCSLVSEESEGRSSPGSGLFFAVDPLDGSMNFLHGFPAYSFAIGGGRSDSRRFSRIEAAYALDLSTGDEYCALKGKGAFLNGSRLRVPRRGTCKELICAELGNAHPASAGSALNELAKIGYPRMLGACVNELCAVARGTASAYVEPFMEIRSVHAPACLIAKEAGARVTDAAGEPLDFAVSPNSHFSVIACEPSLHPRIMRAVKAAFRPGPARPKTPA